jgi:membrane protease YdiL (CAAX protease family)
MRPYFRELWQWCRANGGLLFLTTVAAYPQLHYMLYGPPAHVLVLPGLAVAVFLVLPLWASVLLDSREWTARTVATFGTMVAMAPALYWAYGDGGRKALMRDGMPLVYGGLVGVLAMLIAVRPGTKGQAIDLAEWGLGLGDWRWWGKPVGFLLALILIGMPIVAWAFPEFVEFYPRYKPGRTSAVALLQYQAAMGAYMFCWEFFFRGFMLFGIARYTGPVAAIVIQCYPFYLLHESKPEPELISSWFGGILMGWLCWKARCMWPSFLLHWVLYSSMEITAFIFRNYVNT